MIPNYIIVPIRDSSRVARPL
uniref:Uncharacterized protein n=1 Tax=Lepeophtheirus salmonis TaxID=72036 RepID=A0A0K2TIJ1_LEPSM